jgi:hypothetical protein
MTEAIGNWQLAVGKMPNAVCDARYGINDKPSVISHQPSTEVLNSSLRSPRLCGEKAGNPHV